MKGTLILAAAGVAVRALGAVYRIPLAWILGDRGLGIYAIPSQLYWLSYLLSTAGLPVGISQVIASKVAAGRPDAALRIFRLVRRLLFLTGLLASLGLMFGARWLIRVGIVQDPESYLGILAIAPVAFFSAITSAYRGLFAGLQVMTPVAVSQLADQAFNVTGTLLFAYLLLPRGLKYAAAGGNLGSLPGALVGLTVALLFARALRKREPLAMLYAADASRGGVDKPDGDETAWKLIKRILVVAIPVSFSAIAMAVVGLADSILVIGRLQAVGVPRAVATAYFGQLNQMAMPFINATITLASAIGVSLVPALASTAVNGSRQQMRRLTDQALDLTLLISLPAAVGLFVLATPLTGVVFRNAAAGSVLAAASTVAVTWSLQMVTAAALQGVLNAGFAMWSLVGGLTVKVVISYLLIPTALGVRASGYATSIGFAVSALVNLWRLGQLGVASAGALGRAGKPAVASVAMGILVALAYDGLWALTRSAALSVFTAVIVGVVSYGVLALVWGFVKPEDLARLPRVGSRLANFASRFKRS